MPLGCSTFWKYGFRVVHVKTASVWMLKNAPNSWIYLYVIVRTRYEMKVNKIWTRKIVFPFSSFILIYNHRKSRERIRLSICTNRAVMTGAQKTDIMFFSHKSLIGSDFNECTFLPGHLSSAFKQMFLL